MPAAPFILLEDGTEDRGGDVSTAPARVLGLHLGLSGLSVGRRVLTVYRGVGPAYLPNAHPAFRK
jgi:hypothetical protein